MVKKIVNGQVEFRFNGKLVNPLGEITLQNSNGKNYKVVTIEFVDINGVIQKTSAMIYEGNYKHGLKQGEEYLCTARKGINGDIYIQMSHLQGSAERATADMFDAFDTQAAPTATVVNTRELAS